MLPEIETERLILRPPKLGDEKPLNQAINLHCLNYSGGSLGQKIRACNPPLISLKRELSPGDRMFLVIFQW